MLLYLDNSVLNRPFDDQSQPRIWFETVAFILVLTLIEAEECEFVWSAFNQLENDSNPEIDRRTWVARCSELAAVKLAIAAEDRIRALELERIGVKPIDALHIASAERAGAEIFLTCDDRLIRRYSGRLKVQTPNAFIENLRTL